MSSSYGTWRRRERQRELGFFDTEGGLLSKWAPLLGGVALASVGWPEGFLWAMGGFVVGVAIVSFMLGNRKTKRRLARMAEWEELLSEIGLRGIEVLGLRYTSRGLRLELSLPGRLTFPQVARATEQIEGGAGLARGGVRVERDEKVAQTVWLHAVLRSEADRESQPFLPDPGQGIASVSNPLPIGVYDDDALCMVQLGHTNTLVTSAAGDDTGTDQFFRVMTAQLARCDDTLIWYAAPGGTRQAAPWLAPREPTLDWVATDLDEVELMLNAALRVARRRSITAPGGDRVEPSPNVPAVVVLLADASLVLRRTRSAQHRRITTTAIELAQLGPREAVTVAVGMRLESAAGLDLMEIRPYCGVIVGLGITHQADAWRIFPDTARPDRDALSGESSMLVWQQRGGRAMPARLFDVSWEDATRIAHECAQRRPVLDDPSAGADHSYGSRWRRWRTAGPGADAEFHRIVDKEDDAR